MEKETFIIVLNDNRAESRTATMTLASAKGLATKALNAGATTGVVAILSEDGAHICTRYRGGAWMNTPAESVEVEDTPAADSALALAQAHDEAVAKAIESLRAEAEALGMSIVKNDSKTLLVPAMFDTNEEHGGFDDDWSGWTNGEGTLEVYPHYNEATGGVEFSLYCDGEPDNERYTTPAALQDAINESACQIAYSGACYIDGLFRQEFPAYPATFSLLVPKNWVDDSWHQDPCPCISHKAYKSVRIYQKLEGTTTRFIVVKPSGRESFMSFLPAIECADAEVYRLSALPPVLKLTPTQKDFQEAVSNRENNTLVLFMDESWKRNTAESYNNWTKAPLHDIYISYYSNDPTLTKETLCKRIAEALPLSEVEVPNKSLLVNALSVKDTRPHDDGGYIQLSGKFSSATLRHHVANMVWELAHIYENPAKVKEATELFCIDEITYGYHKRSVSFPWIKNLQIKERTRLSYITYFYTKESAVSGKEKRSSRKGYTYYHGVNEYYYSLADVCRNICDNGDYYDGNYYSKVDPTGTDWHEPLKARTEGRSPVSF